MSRQFRVYMLNRFGKWQEVSEGDKPMVVSAESAKDALAIVRGRIRGSEFRKAQFKVEPVEKS